MIKFIDQATISLKAGDGGHGCIAFLREKFRAQEALAEVMEAKVVQSYLKLINN